MRSEKSTGRAVGLTLLLPMLISPPLYAVLLAPISGREYFAATATSAMQVRLGLLLLFVAGSMTLTAAIVALPVFRRYSERMAFAFVVLGVMVLATIVIESIAIRSMLALSLEHAATGAPNALIEILGRLARSNRIAAHFTNLVFAHTTMALLYVILYRFALVPRALAGAGIAATILSTSAVTMPLLGYAFSFALIAPMGLVSLTLAVWLMVRGFAARTHSGDSAGIAMHGSRISGGASAGALR